MVTTKARQGIAAKILTENGHSSSLSGNRFILCDTYPDQQQNQSLYLYGLIRGSFIGQDSSTVLRNSRVSGAATPVRGSARMDKGW